MLLLSSASRAACSARNATVRRASLLSLALGLVMVQPAAAQIAPLPAQPAAPTSPMRPAAPVAPEPIKHGKKLAGKKHLQKSHANAKSHAKGIKASKKSKGKGHAKGGKLQTRSKY